MIELTTLLIKKKYLQHQYKQQHKSLMKDKEKNYLKKITHLFMNEQFICEIVSKLIMR
jgi:hypothetical protein